MKHIFRILSVFLTLSLLLCSLVACGGQNWRTDLSVTSLCDTVVAALPAGDGFDTVSDGYVSASSWGDDYADYMALVTDYRIIVSVNSDMNVDEIGVFQTANAKDADKMKTFVEKYLEAKQLRMTPLLESYNQAELPKLDNADVTVCGNYVLYTILNASDTTNAHSAFEKALQTD
ncbi:MAG: DUF4358 domain-containing protein [Clostridia bacterium]|nr:DUF4358 domain-containing protein [Clostridia bacterium]